METCDKCLCTTGFKEERGGTGIGRSSSPMAVRGGKQHCDFTTLAAERLGKRVDSKRSTPHNEGVRWENELDKLAISRAAKSDVNVREGILVNLECDESEMKEEEITDKPRGPRHCSVRLQAGSTNILLDNVVESYTPVLYKSRPDALVHSPRSRSGSSNSSSEEKPIRTETQI